MAIILPPQQPVSQSARLPHRFQGRNIIYTDVQTRAEYVSFATQPLRKDCMIAMIEAQNLQRATIPITKPVNMERLKEFLADSRNQHFSVSGAAGSGKSSILPRLLAQDLPEGAVMVVTPHHHHASKMVEYLRSLVGVDTKRDRGIIHLRRRDDTEHAEDKARIVVVTEGLAILEIFNDLRLGRFPIVLFDEAQVLSPNLESLLAYAKMSMIKGTKSRYGVISATPCFDDLRAYINLSTSSHYIFPSSTFTRKILHQESVPSDLPAWVMKIVQQFLESDKTGNILVFASGKYESRLLVEAIRSGLGSALEHVEVYCISAGVVDEEKRNATRPMIDGCRQRLIVATNVLENSITIPQIKSLIDSGEEKINVFDPLRERHRLVTQQVSSASSSQRSGRAGRTSDSIVYRAYPNALFGAQNRSVGDFTGPLLVNLAIARECNFGSAGFRNMLELMNPVPAGHLEHAILTSRLLGAVTTDTIASPDSVRLTEIGSQITRLSCSHEYARSLIAAVDNNCASAMALLVAAQMTGQNLLLAQTDMDKETWLNQQEIMSWYPDSDHLCLYYVLKSWILRASVPVPGAPRVTVRPQVWTERMNFAKYYGLRLSGLEEGERRAEALRQQMKMQGMFRDQPLGEWSSNVTLSQLIRSLVVGHGHKVAVLVDGSEVYTRLGGQKARSSLYGKKCQYVLYSEAWGPKKVANWVLKASKGSSSQHDEDITTMTNLSALEPDWLPTQQ